METSRPKQVGTRSQKRQMRTVGSRVAISSIAVLFAKVLVSCAGDTLVGEWHTTDANTFTRILRLEANGGASIEITGATCHGSVRINGLTWLAVDGSFTLSGPGPCSGSASCVFGLLPSDISCGSGAPPGGTCRFERNGDVLRFSLCAGTVAGNLEAAGPFARGTGL